MRDIESSPNYRWIYTYDYAPNQVWEKWRDKIASDEWIVNECARVSGKIDKSILNFALLTDSHYVQNGTWSDTITCLHKLDEEINLNGIIHLGDLSDGMLTLEETNDIVDKVKSDMNSIGKPVYITPGNHDYNYFRGNPDLLYPEKPQYFVDYQKDNLRLIFIDSFDPKEPIRYGFTEYCIHWLESVLYSMPKHYKAIIFSHVPPLVRLQTWTSNIRNRHLLIDVLNKYAENILAFLNGHTHCDHLFNDLHNGKFPIVAINNSKCECFLDHKPNGGVTPYRELGTKNQESFDIMSIDTRKRKVYFTRFGAGDDRFIEKGQAKWKSEH